jgi:dihydrofolate synthase/folylpolyglutamate synthase
MTYRESLDWLYGLQVHGIKLGLENMQRLCAALGIELESGEKRRFLHVAGTNGKGSVCAMLAAICCAAGKRTGLYTSPHLVSFRERIRLGGNLIPEEHVAEGLETIRNTAAGWDHSPTFFEVTTALALAWFQRQRAAWLIWETGLGGRLDATNVVTPAVSVITSIGLDHTQYLGMTLAEVAREKAGIIKRGVPVVSAPQAPEAEAVLREVAEQMEAPLTFVQKPVAKTWEMALPGEHQRWNAALAFAAVVTAGLRPEPRLVADALRDVEWPGRFQSLWDGRMILDGAHNPAAAERLAATWREQFGDDRCTLIIGVLADKDIRGILRALVPLAARVICVPVRNPRTMAAVELARLAGEMAPEVPREVQPDFGAALAEAGKYPHRILTAGSLFLVGEALERLGLASSEQEFSAQ